MAEKATLQFQLRPRDRISSSRQVACHEGTESSLGRSVGSCLQDPHVSLSIALRGLRSVFWSMVLLIKQ